MHRYSYTNTLHLLYQIFFITRIDNKNMAAYKLLLSYQKKFFLIENPEKGAGTSFILLFGLKHTIRKFI